MKKIISAVLIGGIMASTLTAMATGTTVKKGQATYNMNTYGTALTVTNNTGEVVYFDLALIKYNAGATNAVTFSKISGGVTYLLETKSSTNSSAATAIWEPSVRVPFYPFDVLSIGTTATNMAINIVAGEQ